MKSPRLSPPRQGTALVVVLSCIVIMSILLISYLVAMQLDRLSTQNYAQGIKAQELALGALQEILGDLRQEIDAGSLADGTPTGAAYTSQGVRIFIPATNRSAMPARLGFTTSQFANLPSSLVRVSRAADPFFVTPPAGYDAALLPTNRASAAPSTAPSANRRLITSERWNKPMLFGTNVPAVFSNSPPDWIYATRGGSRVLTAAELATLSASSDLANSNAVLGRYSYVIYEQGGLLDINAAGYPSSALSESGGTNAIGGKSYTAYADLAQIPGLTTNAVDSLINWRSKGSLAAATNLFLPSTATNATNGFRTFQSGDSPLLGRQDLINYFKQTPSLASNLGALASLGTFSRALNAPSWCPSTPTGSTVDYAANAESPTFFHPGEGNGGTANTRNPNRNIANLRVPNATTVTHYRDDGSTSTYSIKAGEPLAQRRFSLARLAWLTPNGPASGKNAAVQDCFGLTWSNDNHGVPCWKYDHGNSQEILTLDQVATLGREPDFFELLKAAILSGSLGKHPGAANAAKDDNTDVWSNPPGVAFGDIGVAGAGFENSSSFPDLQILQIGASIIDQFDADSFPTQIYFDPSLDASLVSGPQNIVFGQENLPHLTRLFNLVLEKTSGALDGWLQPELWNLNQVPATLPADRPTKFRLSIYGGVVVSWHQRDASVPTGKRQAVSATRVFDGSLATGYLYFTDPGGLASPFCQGPVVLTTTNAGTYGSTTADNVWQPSTYQTTDGGNPFLAFHAGTALFGTGTATSDPQDIDTDIVAQIVPSSLLTVALEYSPDNGVSYRPYSHLSRISSYYPTGSRPNLSGRTSASNPGMHFLVNAGELNLGSGVTPNCIMFYSRSDPRTDRFSLNNSQINHGGQAPNGGWQAAWRGNLSLVPYGFTGGGLMVSPRRNPPRPDDAAAGGAKANPPNQFHYAADAVRSGWGAAWQNTFSVGAWVQNLPYDSGDDRAKWSWLWYADPDGVVRPGDGYRVLYTEPNGDGTMLFTTPANSPANSQNARRPLILNRPFRSVGELGYVFRDLPYKSLDFFSAKSADAALLDIFSLTDEPAVIAGQINPNYTNPDVLKAVLTGASKKEIDASVKLSDTTAQLIADTIANSAKSAGGSLIANRADLATRLSDPLFAALPATPDSGNKAYLEAPIRALSSVSNTRTWNLLIDVIAQTGRFSKNAQSLNDFTVEGEKRYWLHIALDRYTGKIVDQQLEPVYE